MNSLEVSIRLYKEGQVEKLNINGNTWNATGEGLTMILSLSIMVFNLCAMVSTVHWANFSRIFFCINSSVLEPKELDLVQQKGKSRLKTENNDIFIMFLKIKDMILLLKN